MPDLDTWASIAEIAGGATIVGGVAFTLVQLAHMRRSRRETAAIEFVRSIQTPAFLEAEQRIWALSEGLQDLAGGTIRYSWKRLAGLSTRCPGHAPPVDGRGRPNG